MIEQGIVKEILKNGLARVYFKAGGGCEKCGACIIKGNEAYIDAINEAKAKVGDPVRVEIPAGNVLKAVSLLFILPIICLIAGFFMGGVLWAFLSLFICYFLIFLYDRTFHFSNAKSIIVEVL